MPEMSFGRSIKYRRHKLGLSQTRLGELVGRSAAAVRSWERDASTPTDPDVLQALSAVLGIERDVLFAKAGVDPPEVESSPTVEEVLGSLSRDIDRPEVESSPRVEERSGSLADDSDDNADTGADEVSPQAPPAVAVAPSPMATSVPAQPEAVTPSFDSNGPRFLYTTPAPPVVEPTYMEDQSQRQLYRIRNLATLVLVVALVVLFVWAAGNGVEAFSAWWGDFVSYLQL